jgi:anti-sigma regulatory factor (Ser/Thr protein kinase)
MNAIAPTRPAQLLARRIRLARRPAAAAEARRHVQTTIINWDVPVDPEVAVLLTSELVTNAVTHETGEHVTLVIRGSHDRLRVEVHDTSCAMPVPMDVPAEAETGRGLMLVDNLADDWGFYRTPAGKAVYFMLLYPCDPAGESQPAVNGNGRRSRAVPPGRSPRRNGAKR